MRVTRVRAFRLVQPFRRGTYTMSNSTADASDTLIVALDTDARLTGWGEMGAINMSYSDAFAAGARAGVGELAPALLGSDPTQPRAVSAMLDALMRGQPYVKAAIDMACWDLVGKRAQRPLCEALGGRFGERVATYDVVTSHDVEAATREARELVGAGRRRVQVKVGWDPLHDAARMRAVRDAVGPGIVLFADANGGFTTADALRFVREAAGLDYSLEQPCARYDECRVVRAHCGAPFILDESIITLADLLRAHRDGVVDGVTIKLGRVGGVTRAALMRDVAVELGVGVTVEDTGGGSISTAAVAHVMHSTPEAHRIHMADLNSWVTVDSADGMTPVVDGALAAPTEPGLGVTVSAQALGEPFLDIS